MYARLEHGTLISAPKEIKLRRLVIIDEETSETAERLFSFRNPTAEQYAEAGYLPVIESAPPEAPEGYHYEPDYTEDGGEIVQVWELVEDPDPEEQEVSAEEALDIILGGGDNEA